MPLRSPSTMCRARISNRPIRLITSGCKDLLEAVVMNQLVVGVSRSAEPRRTLAHPKGAARLAAPTLSGCKDLLEAVVMNQLVFVGGCDVKQAIDDLVGRNAVAFGGKIHDEPVPEHGLDQCADVFQCDVRPTLNQR